MDSIKWANKVRKNCVNLRTIINTALKFDEESHTYYYNGRNLISCTQLLEKHHLSPSYSGVNEELLKKAAEYGNAVHKDIELFIKKNQYLNTIEQDNFIAWLENSGYEVVDSEYLVCNDIIGGKVDLLLRHKESDVYVIADIKTTSVIHKESVSWQLSLYNYLDEDIALVGMCIHYQKDGSFEIESIPLKAPKDIENLIECERQGKIFQYQLDNINSALSKVGELENLITNYKSLIKQAEEEQKELHKQIRDEMESRCIKTLELPNMKITIVEDSIRETVDTKKLKEEQPDIYNQYLKQTKVKCNLKITLKKGGEN